MQGTKAALQVVVDGVHYQSVIQRTDSQREVTTMGNGVEITTYYGAPQELWPNHLEPLMQHSFTYLGNAYKDNGLFDKICEDSVCVIDQIKLSSLFSYSQIIRQGMHWRLFPKGTHYALIVWLLTILPRPKQWAMQINISLS